MLQVFTHSAMKFKANKGDGRWIPVKNTQKIANIVEPQ